MKKETADAAVRIYKSTRKKLKVRAARMDISLAKLIDSMEKTL